MKDTKEGKMNKHIVAVIDYPVYLRYYFCNKKHRIKRIEYHDINGTLTFFKESIEQLYPMEVEIRKYFLSGKATLTEQGKEFLSL